MTILFKENSWRIKNVDKYFIVPLRHVVSPLMCETWCPTLNGQESMNMSWNFSNRKILLRGNFRDYLSFLIKINVGSNDIQGILYYHRRFADTQQKNTEARRI